MDRLTIERLELKNLPGLLTWLAQQQPSHLDILVDNAAQTVWRPPACHAGWQEQEWRLAGADATALVASRTDAMFPIGLLDEEGLPVDLRPTNSWRAVAEDVPPVGTNGLGDEGARMLGAALERRLHVQTIYLGCNLIGSERASKPIARADQGARCAARELDEVVELFASDEDLAGVLADW